jgi:hypothetical protein
MLELNKGENLADLLRVIALSELESPAGSSPADKLYQEIVARDLADWDLFNSQLLLRFLGRKAEAMAVSRKFLTQPDRFPPVRKVPFQLALEFCAGQRSAADLIASMHGNRGDLCNAHLCIALTALAAGDRAEARKHFQLCVETRHYEFFPYDLSQMILSRMDKDNAWPPWIKPLK